MNGMNENDDLIEALNKIRKLSMSTSVDSATRLDEIYKIARDAVSGPGGDVVEIEETSTGN